jgi:hypothetical protein
MEARQVIAVFSFIIAMSRRYESDKKNHKKTNGNDDYHK